MYKVATVHKKCRQTSKIPVIYKRQTSQCQINSQIPKLQNLIFPALHGTINQVNFVTSIYKKISLAWY